ncbi:MAG: agmatinase [Acidimicrobiales bacterium]
MTARQPTLIGLPYDGSSSYLRGPARAPAAVRRVLHSGAGNWFTEHGVDLHPSLERWIDGGDLDIDDDPATARSQIRAHAAGLAEAGKPIIALGGDHFVTLPLVEALSPRVGHLTIVHIDAHPDFYDELDGERLSHACPFARIMEAGLADRLLQFGVRTMTAHQADQVERFGVEVFTAADWDGRVPPLDGDVYLTIDVDGLDPAYAPGVSHHEPGGLTTRQVIDLINQVGAQPDVIVVGADIVEINPDRDINDMTAAVGAKLLKELLGVMITQP